MDIKNNKRTLYVLILGCLTIIIAIYIYYSIFDPIKSLKDELARVFNRPAELIELNLPPADGRYPGAVLVTAQQGQSLIIKKKNRPDSIPRTTSYIKLTLDGSAKAKFFNNLFGNLNSSGDTEIQIELKNLRMFEIDLDSTFKEELLEDEITFEASKKGLMPRAIIRAYEAVVTYTIKNNNTIEGNNWDTIKNELLNVGGSLKNADRVEINTSEPTIIAFESMLCTYISTNLNEGKPSEIIFREHIAKDDIENINAKKKMEITQ